MICSGVRTYGSDASAPGIEACVYAFSPSAAQRAPVATTTISAPYSPMSCAESSVPVITSTFLSFSSCTARQLRKRAQSREPGNPAHHAADLGGGVDEMHATEAALAENDRALHSGGPRPDHENV